MTTERSEQRKPSVSRLVGQVAEGIATRLQIAGLEFSVARDNTASLLINAVIACLFGIFTLVFVSLALLIYFWEDHRVFVSCCLAGFYLVMFLFFLGRAKGLAANLPYAFAETRQILARDAETIRAAAQQKATEQEDSHESQ